LAAIALDSYRSTLNSSFEAAENIATLVDQDIARNSSFTICRFKPSPKRLGSRTDGAAAAPASDRAVRSYHVRARARRDGGVDKKGNHPRFLQSPARAGNFGDREYFKFQRDTPHPDGFYISRLSKPAFNTDLESFDQPAVQCAGRQLCRHRFGPLKLDFLKQRLASIALGKNGVGYAAPR